MTIHEAIQSFLHDNCPAEGTDGKPFLSSFVGFSGGADSTALLLALSQLQLVPVTAVHFHHGIRGQEADEDEAWCRQFCEKRNIPFLSRHLDVPQRIRHGESCEEAARRLRLEAWQELSQGSPIWLAHHADDAMEELFLRLARGSNASALVPMKPMRRIQGITFLRPLLEMRKRQLEEWLRSQGIHDWRLDSTNAQSEYRRNAVRNRLLPLFREIFKEETGLLHAISALQEDAAFLDESAVRAFEGLRSIQDWQALSPAMLPRCARLLLEREGIGTPLTRPFILRLSHSLAGYAGSSQALPLDSGTTLRLDATGLHLQMKETLAWAPVDWDWRATPLLRLGRFTLQAAQTPPSTLHDNFKATNGRCEHFDATALPPRLHIRPWCPGDRMVPFGASAPKKLQDLFTNAKTPRERRAELPVILAGEQIAWVPTVRRAALGALGPENADDAITISFEEEE